MKINGSGIERIIAIYKKQGIENKKAGKISGAGAASKADKIELSREAKDFQVALQAYRELPEIRESKVEEIKSKIAAGTYSVDAEQVADKIVESLFIDEKI